MMTSEDPWEENFPTRDQSVEVPNTASTKVSNDEELENEEILEDEGELEDEEILEGSAKGKKRSRTIRAYPENVRSLRPTIKQAAI